MACTSLSGHETTCGQIKRKDSMSDSPQQLFNDNSQALVAQRDEAAVARATQEIQAALVIAQRFGRDEVKAKSRILTACQRKELAEVAEYEYSRGGTRITGPTIDLLRAIANRWGNLRYGWSEVDRRDGDPCGMSMIRCFAWDLLSNGQAERTFAVKHWRDTSNGGYPLKDERDIYELIANQAARRVRACLEEVIDSDIVQAAVDQCRRTLVHGEKVPLSDRAAGVVNAFTEFGVTQEMIETRLGNKMTAISENQLASLRRIYKSLKDGVGKREDYFKGEVAKPEFGAGEKSPEAKPETASSVKPSTTQGATVGGSSSVSTLPLIRGSCAARGITEGQLLDYLTQTGTSDGSAATLEELAMTQPNVVGLIIDQWSKVAQDILEKGKK